MTETDPANHILTEHVTQHTVRACEDQTEQSVPEKLLEKEADEHFRKENPQHDKDHPRYRGIAANLGNPVFTNTPCEPPSYVRPQVTLGIPGYERPKQHPYYQTTSRDYGCQPSPESFPLTYHGRTFGFTKRQQLGGMYEDTHFTTQLDDTPISP